MSLSHNDLFGHAASDESDGSDGYDSEAAEVTKASRTAESGRSRKRRRLSPSDSEGDESEMEAESEHGRGDELTESGGGGGAERTAPTPVAEEQGGGDGQDKQKQGPKVQHKNEGKDSKDSSKRKKKKKERRAGVIYLSSIPPHLRPSALRNLLEQRGFGPVTRLFLTPITKDAAKKAGSTSKARRSYAEGWVEFASHKTAKLCAQTLNATAIGGKKGSYYRDDLWNMKYLRGMGWEELMDGVRGEKREEEARRDEERRQIQRDAKIFLEGVEQGKRVEGMREKRRRKGQTQSSHVDGDGGDNDGQRMFRQFETHRSEATGERVDEEAQQVLSKIF